MSLEKLIESRIQDAAAAGVFDGLPGAGKPQRFDPSDELAGDNWMGFKILRDGGMLPAWLMLAKEIEEDELRLEGAAARYRDWVTIARDSGQWPLHAPLIGRLREGFAAGAIALRKKQDRFNIDAPSVALERPAIWVDHRLEQLDDELRQAGAPRELFPWLESGPR